MMKSEKGSTDSDVDIQVNETRESLNKYDALPHEHRKFARSVCLLSQTIHSFLSSPAQPPFAS